MVHLFRLTRSFALVFWYHADLQIYNEVEQKVLLVMFTALLFGSFSCELFYLCVSFICRLSRNGDIV